MGLHIENFYRPATVNCMDGEKKESLQRGARIRAMRKALGWNQSELAEKLGVDQSTVSDIERGSGFAADLLMRLSDSLESSPGLIMRGYDEAAWPFKRVHQEAFTALSLEDRSYVEGVLAQTIADLGGMPTQADMENFRASHVRVRKSTPKRKTA